MICLYFPLKTNVLALIQTIFGNISDFERIVLLLFVNIQDNFQQATELLISPLTNLTVHCTCKNNFFPSYSKILEKSNF